MDNITEPGYYAIDKQTKELIAGPFEKMGDVMEAAKAYRHRTNRKTEIVSPSWQ